MRTRSAEKVYAKNYLKRAEECKNSMNIALTSGEWNSCVINAIHCAIAAADAFCIFKLGIRNAGERHADAIALFLSIDRNDAEIKRNANHLSRLLDIKTNAEYGERLLNRKDSNEASKHAERLLSFVRGKIKI